MLKMLITPREILFFPRYEFCDFWRGTASCTTSREVIQGVVKHLVSNGVAWFPVSHTGAAQ